MIPEEDTQRQYIEQVVKEILASNNITQGGAKNVLKRGDFRSPLYAPGLRGWKIDSEGRAEFNDLWVTGMVKTVSVGESIQDAINTLSQFGGGIVQLDAGTFILNSNIEIKSNIYLTGTDISTTILDFNNTSNGLRITGDSTTQIVNFSIANLTVKNSTSSSGGIRIDYADKWKLRNVISSNHSNAGYYISHSRDFFLEQCQALSNGSVGFLITGGSPRYSARYTLINCLSQSNTNDGYFIAGNNNYLFYGNILGCRSDSNGADGFDINSSGGSTAFVLQLIGCVSSNNTGYGFQTDANTQQVDLVSCSVGVSNTLTDFRIYGADNKVIGCHGADYDIQSSGIFTGNSLTTGSSVDPHTNFSISVEGTLAQLHSQYNGNMRTSRKVMTMKNNSGGSLAQGDVVILDAVATGDNITTTTTGGNNKVWGMADEAISNGNWGIVLVEGFTTKLKVDGTTAISIGDYLSCFTTAKIAQKASAGHMAFAIALEAYSNADSNGVVDALIISPRLI